MKRTIILVLAVLFILAACGGPGSSSSSWKLHTTSNALELLAFGFGGLMKGTWANSPSELGFKGRWGNTVYATRLEADGTTSIICYFSDENKYCLIKYKGNWEEEQNTR